MDLPEPSGQRSGEPGDGLRRAEPIMRALTGLMGRLREHSQAVGRELDLAPPAVMALGQINPAISMTELGELLGCERSFVTAIADALEEKGLVRREGDRRDRRVKNLVLTPEGAAMRARADARFFAQLPWVSALDDAERATLLTLLAKLAAAAESASASPAEAGPEL